MRWSFRIVFVVTVNRFCKIDKVQWEKMRKHSQEKKKQEKQCEVDECMPNDATYLGDPNEENQSKNR